MSKVNITYIIDIGDRNFEQFKKSFESACTEKIVWELEGINYPCEVLEIKKIVEPVKKEIRPHDCESYKTYCHNDYFCDICGQRC